MTAPLVSTTDRPYQLLPPLTVEQRDLLRQSIRENGVLEPVVFDEDGEILDGHHRVEIAEELGIEYPRRVIEDLDRPGKHMYALTVNVARRHLDQSSRGSLVAQMRIRGMSIRQIAKAVGVDPKTVRNDLAQVGTDSPPARVTGSDGKSYAATRPIPEPARDPEPLGTPTPEPVASAPSAVAGSGSSSLESESERHLSVVRTDPEAVERRKQIVEDAERTQAISNAHKKADRLLSEVSGMVTEIVSGVRFGEPGLITAEMIAGLRAEADRLEQWMEQA